MATQNIKVVPRKPLRWWEKLYIPQVLAGMKITLGIMLRKPVTLKYPLERPVIPKGYRGLPTLVKDQNGREKCVSCQLCEFVCPPKAIRITPGPIDPAAGNDHVEKAPAKFEINMLRCIYCGMCQEVCPEAAIVLQSEYSLNGRSRAAMIHDKKKLYELGGTIPDPVLKWDKKKAAREAARAH
ncbi:MAG TPA: NADH-quinone oxidoreductase subunit I [Candidatus Spyradosoma merdigallinarum]|uniref:NADH-quinone oxidoreductase subunit I n=1 Tax=Candidatus Spyradosoma merdigallinarum TaxID=2840950 RepID=A0A9D1NKM6_9BACT|nr:NADH-quinone oxidoreductase subunit I [Candidatus Spyradosoma merdigallinarum]